MSDKMTMVLLLLAVAGGVGAAMYYFVFRPRGDVRKIDAAHQDRPKAGVKSAPATPTVAKTAQLSALRDRLADAQVSPTGLKKMPAKAADAKPVAPAEKSWRPEDAGLMESSAVEATANFVAAPAAEPIRPVAKPLTPSVASTVEAPVAHVPQIVQPPISAPAGGDAGAPPAIAAAAKIQILLVDDSKVVRVKTEKLLLNKGYAVTTAIDGIDALAKLETLKPAIIITDIEMPNLDGFGLVRNVRGNLRTAEIPVIVMTSHVNLHLDIAATEGINGFLPKPFNDQDLLDQVAFLCES